MYYVDYNDGTSWERHPRAFDDLEEAKIWADELFAIANWDARVVDSASACVYARWRNRW